MNYAGSVKATVEGYSCEWQHLKSAGCDEFRFRLDDVWITLRQQCENGVWGKPERQESGDMRLQHEIDAGEKYRVAYGYLEEMADRAHAYFKRREGKKNLPKS